MQRDPGVYLDDIIEACRKITRYTEGFDIDRFRDDEKTVDAVVRNLEIIGEAAKKLPRELRDKTPAIEWQRIAGLRDVLIHHYFSIDFELIWDIVSTKIPALLTALTSGGTD